MIGLKKEIGLHYGNQAAKLGIFASKYIKQVLGVDLQLTDIGSGEVTEVYYQGHTFDCHYEFIYDDEVLTGIRLLSDGNPHLDRDLVVVVDDLMRGFYQSIMAATYLLGILDKADQLSDEAMVHSDNWNDII